ncbi:MAG: tyrosine--tRNA ligase [Oligoflexia bacterium]|nr:tyrosine--tRNA ligase [Oligoflexia bacterium]
MSENSQDHNNHKDKKINEKLDEKLEQEVQRQYGIISKNTVEIVPDEDLKNLLRWSISSGTPLRVKCGIDPTSSNVHVGHLVPYRKMREFQDLGHTGVVIIGDYTAQIGDPSGKNETRPPLSAEETKNNAATYMEQIFTVLDRNKTEIRHQTEWFSKTTLAEILRWASQTTVAKLLSHETFKRRIDAGNPLALHEFFYPILQGMDSVFINAHVELGGTDQRFNVLMGRDFQRARGERTQVAILLPIILGLCGTQKMSKSLGNYVGINDEPFDKFGKFMSIPDNLMSTYYRYILWSSEEEILRIESGIKDGSLHPNEIKKTLAQKVVAFFHGEDVGQKMREQFESVFSKGKIPDEISEFKFERGKTLTDLLVDSQTVSSRSEVRRLVQQKAIIILEDDKSEKDGVKVSDQFLVIDESYCGKIVKTGKRRFLKLK